jgi:hypothetical protein
VFHLYSHDVPCMAHVPRVDTSDIHGKVFRGNHNIRSRAFLVIHQSRNPHTGPSHFPVQIASDKGNQLVAIAENFPTSPTARTIISADPPATTENRTCGNICQSHSSPKDVTHFDSVSNTVHLTLLPSSYFDPNQTPCESQKSLHYTQHLLRSITRSVSCEHVADY